jgi:hypothetical protein
MEFPEFRSERELIEWFETADLARLKLEKVLEVEVSDQVSLEIEGPWATLGTAVASGTTGHIDAVLAVR